MSHKIYYSNSTEEQKKHVEQIIYNNVFCHTHLVEELLTKEIFSYDDIENLTEKNPENEDEENIQEIYQWFLITDDYYANKLEELGEPILRNDYGNWWGRTCCGQAVVLDPTWWDIVYNNEE